MFDFDARLATRHHCSSRMPLLGPSPRLEDHLSSLCQEEEVGHGRGGGWIRSIGRPAIIMWGRIGVSERSKASTRWQPRASAFSLCSAVGKQVDQPALIVYTSTFFFFFTAVYETAFILRRRLFLPLPTLSLPAVCYPHHPTRRPERAAASRVARPVQSRPVQSNDRQIDSKMEPRARAGKNVGKMNFGHSERMPSPLSHPFCQPF